MRNQTQDRNETLRHQVNEKRPVLLLGDEPRVVVTVARSLHRHGITVDVCTLAPPARALRSRAIRRIVTLPSPHDEPERFLAALLDQIEDSRPDMVIPCSDGALAAAARFHAELTVLVHVACPPPEIVNRVLVKALTLETAAAEGIAVPRTYLIHDAGDLGVLAGARFPVIVKPRRKMESVPFKVKRFDTLGELRAAFAADPYLGQRCLIQQYCPGEGVGIEVLMRSGEPLLVFQHRRIKELPRTGGVSVVAVSEAAAPALAEQAIRLLRALEWDGVAMVEFRHDPETGAAALMEVNGRYWGSLPVTARSGLDIPWYHWQAAHGLRPDIPPAYHAGVQVRWTGGALQRLHEAARDAGRAEVLKEVRGFIGDLRPQTKDALWSVSDPMPGVFDALGTAFGIAAGELKTVLTRILPDEAVSLIRLSRTLGLRSGIASGRARLARAVGLGRRRLVKRAGSIKSVLFVCHGNIIRSPMAAGLLRRCAAQAGRDTLTVSSAGLHAHPFNGPDLRAVQLAPEFGISLQHHRAQPLSREMVRKADAVFVMDYVNEAELLARYPEARRKVFLLGACAPADGALCSVQIEDPYRGELEDVRRCYALLQARVDDLARVLLPTVPAAAQRQEREEAAPARAGTKARATAAR